MSFSQEEINKILDDLTADFCKVFETKDPDQIVQFYHPHAVMIQVGRFVKYGREEIKEVIKEWLATPAQPENHPEKRLVAGDGEYLFDIGKMDLKFTNGTVCSGKYECIYKRENGKYLLYQDKYELIDGGASEKSE